MSRSERLYTPELLGLAVELAQWPPLARAPHRGEARSAACGSTLDLGLVTDDEDRIDALGMRVRACAIGQAAAGVFARHARGRTLADLDDTRARLETWLAGDGAMPDWPDLALIEAARAFPGRHGAIMLPWNAAVAALSSEPGEG